MGSDPSALLARAHGVDNAMPLRVGEARQGRIAGVIAAALGRVAA